MFLDTTPPKEVLRSGRMTFTEAGFVPRANVYFSYNDPQDTLNNTAQILSQASMERYSNTSLQAEVIVSQIK